LVNLLSLKEKLYFLLRFTTHKLHELLPPKKAQSQQPRWGLTHTRSLFNSQMRSEIAY
jgi:hypothetical protein